MSQTCQQLVNYQLLQAKNRLLLSHLRTKALFLSKTPSKRQNKAFLTNSLFKKGILVRKAFSTRLKISLTREKVCFRLKSSRRTKQVVYLAMSLPRQRPRNNRMTKSQINKSMLVSLKPTPQKVYSTLPTQNPQGYLVTK